MSKSVVLIPHGAGNISSLMEVFHQVGYFPKVAESTSHIHSADMAVIPGVGASGSAMSQLRQNGFADAIVRMNERQRPIIGICVGAQVMFSKLHENECTGLELIPGEVARIAGGEFNNGWSEIRLNARSQESDIRKNRPLLLKTAIKTFYFNHGYHIKTSVTMQESAYTGDDRKLLAYFVRDNLCGIQFHPEKSHRFGKKLFSAFAGIN